MDRADRGRWTLVAVCATTFMLLVDITIVNVALPSVQRELHASLTGLQWVVDAYAVSLAALILTAGALADRFGRKRVFELGIILFTVASLLCGFAWNIAALDKAGTRDAVMVGDSRWDIEAAAKAGLETICVVTGGWSEQELRDHGAAAVFDSPADLVEHLDETPLG